MEMSYFERDRGTPQSPRRHIHINLQGRSTVFQKYEVVDQLRQADVYSKGVTSLDKNPLLWQTVVDKVEESVRQDNAVLLYKAVLTSTLDRLKAVPLTRKSTKYAPTFEETLERIGIKRAGGPDWQTVLERYYGLSRSDWKPFGGVKSIEVILSELRD